MKNLTRSERRELADLLHQARLGPVAGWTVAEPDWAEVEAWEDRLRGEAGPVEPTSYAARFIAKRLDEGHVRRVAEWAREFGSNTWQILGADSTGGLAWDELVSAHDGAGWTIEIVNPEEN